MNKQEVTLHIFVKSKLDDGFCYFGYDVKCNKIWRPLSSVDICTAKCKPFKEPELYIGKAYKFSYYSSEQENLPKPHGNEDLIVTSAEEVPTEITWDALIETLFSFSSPKLKPNCQAYMSSARTGGITKYYVNRSTNCPSMGILLVKTLKMYTQYNKKRVEASVRNAFPSEPKTAVASTELFGTKDAPGQENTRSSSETRKRRFDEAFAENETESLCVLGDSLNHGKKQNIETEREIDEEENICSKQESEDSFVKQEESKDNYDNGLNKPENEKFEIVFEKNKDADQNHQQALETSITGPDSIITNAEHDTGSDETKLSALVKLDQEPDKVSENFRDTQNCGTSGKEKQEIIKNDTKKEICSVELITDNSYNVTEDWAMTYDFPYTAPEMPNSNNLNDSSVDKLLFLSMCRPGGGRQPDKCFLIAVGVLERKEQE